MPGNVEFLVTAIDQATAPLKKITSGMKDFQTQSEKSANNLKSSFTKISGALGALGVGTLSFIAVKDAIVKATAETVKYADEVRKLSQLTGESGEEMSRVIQVADDYKISTEALTMAQKTLAKDGISLSIESLGKLSDEYNKLGSGADKTRFLEKFGRSGLQAAELMQQGSEKIAQAGEGISKGLILDDAALKSIRDYEIAMDNLNDIQQEVNITIGKTTIPIMTNLASAFVNIAEAESLADLQLRNYILNIQNAPIDSATQSYIAMADALAKVSESAEPAAEDMKDIYDIGQKIAGLDSADKMKEFADQMLYASLAVDGLTEAELQMLQNAGAISQSEKDKALALQEATTAYADGSLSAWGYNAALRAIYAMPNNKTFTITTIYRTVREAENLIASSGGQGGRKQAGDWMLNNPGSTRASGGWLGSDWTLVGDMPGGKPTQYSELIDPKGYVYNAKQTKAILDSFGGVPTSRAYGGIGWDWTGGGSSGTGTRPPSGTGGATGGRGTGTRPPSTSSGGTTSAAVITAAETTAQAANQSAAASQQVAQVTVEQIVEQTAMSSRMIVELQNISAKFDRLPLQIRDAIQQAY